MKRLLTIVMAAVTLAVCTIPAQAQNRPRISTLVSQALCTNGTTRTFAISTNILHGMNYTASVRLTARVEKAVPNAPTNGNYCTNLVLKFNYLSGTNLTTDTPFTWTIATDQLGTLSANALTNPVVVGTNLAATVVDSLTGIQFTSALGSSTNEAGFKLTVTAAQTP